MTRELKYTLIHVTGMCVTFGQCAKNAYEWGMSMAEPVTFFSALAWSVFWPAYWLVKLGFWL